MASDKDGFFAQLGRSFAPPPWSLIEAGLAFGVLILCLIMIGSAIAAGLSPDSNFPTPTALLIGWTVGLVIAGVFVLVRWRSSQEKFTALRISGESAQSARPVSLMFLLGIGVGLMANLFAGLGSDNNFETIAPLQGIYAGFELSPLVLAILFAVIVQPIAEGLIFFGVIQPRLRASIGAYPGLITTALLYAGTHYLIYGLRPDVVVNPLWFGFIAPLVVGLMLGVVRVWTRSTRATIVANIGAGIVAILVMVAV